MVFEKGDVPWNKGRTYTYEELCGAERAEEWLNEKRGIRQSQDTINKRVINPPSAVI